MSIQREFNLPILTADGVGELIIVPRDAMISGTSFSAETFPDYAEASPDNDKGKCSGR